jgi:hypothetical protein
MPSRSLDVACALTLYVLARGDGKVSGLIRLIHLVEMAQGM